VTVTERTEPVDVDTVVTGEWIITLNADREIYRDGAIAVSGANIVYGSTGHSVDTVLIGGEIVLRHKQLTSLDEQELRRGVEAINRRVLGEIGIAPLPEWPVI